MSHAFLTGVRLKHSLSRTLATIVAITLFQGAVLAQSAPTKPAQETKVATRHTIMLHGKALSYTATAGTLIIRNDDSQPIASMFYVAYTKNGDKSGKRPLTFLFNGGPGSASLWLNIGGFGPVHAPTRKVGATGPAPYAMAQNQNTLLDKSDIVFLDAVGTGYSRAVGTAKGRDFWGVDSDVDSFARAIKRYVTLNGRWNSPKYLFGESYGTTRAAALALKLQDENMDCNGVILMSSYLDTAPWGPGMDQGDIDLLPSYAAAARFHGKVPAQGTLRAFLKKARAFAQGPYATALAQGSTLPAAQRHQIAEQLSHFIGISPAYLERNGLRIGMETFRKELLRDQGKVIGRFDIRFTGPASDMDEHSNPARDDPATAGVGGAYAAVYLDYLTRELHYHTDLNYRILYNMTIEPAWDWHHKAPGVPYTLSSTNTALDLAAAMRANTHLRVYSLNGLYDMSTPFFGTEYDLSRMFLPQKLKKNLQFAYFKSGHMTYTDPDSLRQIHQDLSAYYAAGMH